MDRNSGFTHEPSQSRVQLHAHVEPRVHRELVAVARQNDRSVSAEIRRALAEHLQRERRDPA